MAKNSSERIYYSKLSDSELRQHGRTPKWLFNYLNNYCVELTGKPIIQDLFANEFDALCPNWRGKESTNRKWSKRVFGNPPFNMGPEVAKEILENWERCDFAAFILPASVNSRWWHSIARHVHTVFPERRIQFTPPPGLAYSTNTRDVCFIFLGKKIPLHYYATRVHTFKAFDFLHDKNIREVQIKYGKE